MTKPYYRPNTFKELLSLRASLPNAAILAGGTDLLVYLQEGKIDPLAIIDIGMVEELKSIKLIEKQIVLGAAVTYTEIEKNPLLQKHLPALCAAAASVGSPQIRNRGTVGGSLVNANPSSDIVPAMVAAKAHVLLTSSSGIRQLLIEEFILGSGKTALHTDEIVAEIHIPLPEVGVRMRFDKIGRRNALSIARLNGACLVNLKDGCISDISICIGAATNRPMRMTAAEELLTGQIPSEQLLTKAGQLVSETIESVTGRRSSSAYKLPVAAEFAARLVRDTLESEGL